MKEAFLNRMRAYLQDEYEDWLACLQQPRFRGLRVNTARCDTETFLRLADWPCEPSPICPQSFYVTREHLGLHPLHAAGAFYLQEPSASSAVEVLDVQPHDWVLDLCAAPGGKSTQIAAKLDHTGFLLSNEIEAKRAQTLLSNMERLGFSEYAVSCAAPAQVCGEMAGCFYRVLVDAPCSGEGMFRKHEQAVEGWSEEHVRFCAARQREILACAHEALREGGILVYSTCTYAMEENEETVKAFLERFDDMELIDCGVSFGRPGLPLDDFDSSKVRRIFPMDRGEGHFIAKLRRKGDAPRRARKEEKDKQPDPCVQAFLQDQLSDPRMHLLVQGDTVLGRRQPFVRLGKIRVLRQGIRLGDVVKKRFEPHHHFYMAAVHQPLLRHVRELDLAQSEQFLKGHPLPDPARGFICLRYQGFPLGFGKGDGNWIKNRYPKGLRQMGR